MWQQFSCIYGEPSVWFALNVIAKTILSLYKVSHSNLQASEAKIWIHNFRVIHWKYKLQFRWYDMGEAQTSACPFISRRSTYTTVHDSLSCNRLSLKLISIEHLLQDPVTLAWTANNSTGERLCVFSFWILLLQVWRMQSFHMRCKNLLLIT